MCYTNEIGMSDVPVSVRRYPTGLTSSRAPDTASPPLAVGRTNVKGQDISPIKNLPVRRRGAVRFCRASGDDGRTLYGCYNKSCLIDAAIARRVRSCDGRQPAATPAPQHAQPAQLLIRLLANKCNRRMQSASRANETYTTINV